MDAKALEEANDAADGDTTSGSALAVALGVKLPVPVLLLVGAVSGSQRRQRRQHRHGGWNQLARAALMPTAAAAAAAAGHSWLPWLRESEKAALQPHQQFTVVHEQRKATERDGYSGCYQCVGSQKHHRHSVLPPAGVWDIYFF